MKLNLFFMITCMFVSNCVAGLYDFNFSGQVTGVIENENDTLGSLETGDVFSGTFSYIDVPDTAPLIGLGEYHQNATISMTLGNNVVEHDGFTYVRIWDGLPNDGFIFGLDDASTDDWMLYLFGFTLMDNSQSVYSNDSLPTSFDINDFDTLEFDFIGYRQSTGDQFEVRMEVQDISPIPEPSTVSLAGLASAIIWMLRKRIRC